MSNIAVQGGAGGTGTVTLLAPSTSTDRTLTLPDNTGIVVSTASSAVVTPAMLDTQAQYTGFKNRIINGAMVIDQRNAGASVTPANGAFTLDRWQVGTSQASKFSVQRVTTAPDGFANSLKATSLSAYSVGAAEAFRLQQAIEGFNIADLAWGTANAQAVTLSFRVYSSLTGTFGGSISDSATAYSYPFSYTVSVANTWTTVSVNISGPTSGTWGATNGVGLIVIFSLGAGASVSNTAGLWASGFYASATGAVSVVGTSGATFYITGVQLEKGSTATSFDYRPYGTELALCQRYFAKLQNDGTGGDATLACGIQQSTTAAAVSINYPVTMRSEPTAVISSLSAGDLTTFSNAATLVNINAGYNTASVAFSYSAAGAQFRPVFLMVTSNTTGSLALSAEL